MGGLGGKGVFEEGKESFWVDDACGVSAWRESVCCGWTRGSKNRSMDEVEK